MTLRPPPAIPKLYAYRTGTLYAYAGSGMSTSDADAKAEVKEARERSGGDRALLRTVVHRQLLLRRGQQALGFAEPTEPDQGEGMVPERVPGLGKDRRALANGCPGGRDKEGQSLMHAAGTGQAPAQHGVQARARSTDDLRDRYHGVDHGAGAPNEGVEAEPPGQELVMPYRIDACAEERIDTRHIGAAVQEEVVVEAQEGDLDALVGLGGLALQSLEFRRRLLMPSAHVRCLGGQERRLEALPVVAGGACHALDQLVIAALPGRLRSGHEEIRTAVAAGEAK